MKLLGLFCAALIATAMLFAAPASADPPPPGCQRDPILGLNPQVREVCDMPIQPDGSWTRFRQFSHPEFVHSTCGKYGQFIGGSYYCPPWAPYDSIPAEQGAVEQYIVTPDTVPEGEPGHVDGG